MIMSINKIKQRLNTIDADKLKDVLAHSLHNANQEKNAVDFGSSTFKNLSFYISELEFILAVAEKD